MTKTNEINDKKNNSAVDPATGTGVTVVDPVTLAVAAATNNNEDDLHEDRPDSILLDLLGIPEGEKKLSVLLKDLSTVPKESHKPIIDQWISANIPEATDLDTLVVESLLSKGDWDMKKEIFKQDFFADFLTATMVTPAMEAGHSDSVFVPVATMVALLTEAGHADSNGGQENATNNNLGNDLGTEPSP